TMDPIGGRTLILSNAPQYAAVSASTATAHTGSASFMNFGTGSYGLAPAIPSLTNNFGIELWVNNTNSPASACLIYCGNSGSSGAGIFQNGSTYKGLLGGNAYVGLANAPAGVWMHLALVVSNGTAMFFTNGVIAGSPVAAMANPPAGNYVGIGANPL